MADMNYKIKELEKYVELSGDEWGETVSTLIDLWRCRDYISSELSKLLEQELSDQHKWATESLEIVESVETYTKRVVWLKEK